MKTTTHKAITPRAEAEPDSEVYAILREAIILQQVHAAKTHVLPVGTNAPILDTEILKAMARLRCATPRGLVESLRVSRSSVQRSLSRLARSGQLVSCGKARSRIYRVAEPSQLEVA